MLLGHTLVDQYRSTRNCVLGSFMLHSVISTEIMRALIQQECLLTQNELKKNKKNRHPSLRISIGNYRFKISYYGFTSVITDLQFVTRGIHNPLVRFYKSLFRTHNLFLRIHKPLKEIHNPLIRIHNQLLRVYNSLLRIYKSLFGIHNPLYGITIRKYGFAFL